MDFLAEVRIFSLPCVPHCVFAYFYRAYLFVSRLKAVGADSCPKKIRNHIRNSMRKYAI